MDSANTTKGNKMTTATAMLTKLAEQIAAELPGVREQYSTLELATRLMRRNGSTSIEEAFKVEAKQRVLRNAWAAIEAIEAGN